MSLFTLCDWRLGRWRLSGYPVSGRVGKGRITVMPGGWQGYAAGRARTRTAPGHAGAGPDAACPALAWVGGERIAIGGVPPARLVARLAEQGVMHIVNCRSRAQVRWSGDLAAERAAFGPGRVAHAPMQDHGLRQRPAAWAAAACFAAQVLTEQQAGVLIYCSAGRRRSPVLAYAVLRLRGHAPGAGGSTRAELPTPGRTGSGLCPQRRAVARHDSPVTPATAMSSWEGIRRTVPPVCSANLVAEVAAGAAPDQG